jgi:hypothetical protein
MARKKDLAGLAALGALGYMMSKDKPEKEYRADPYGEMTQEQRDARPDINGRTLADENFSNEGRTPVKAPTRAPARVSNAGQATSAPISADAEAGMTRGTRPRDARDAEKGMSRGTRTTSMAGAGRGMVNPPSVSPTPDMSAYVPRRTPGPLSDTDRPGTRVRYENDDTYKKGGKVSSASSRGDGIASKGKTRGRLL